MRSGAGSRSRACGSPLAGKRRSARQALSVGGLLVALVGVAGCASTSSGTSASGSAPVAPKRSTSTPTTGAVPTSRSATSAPTTTNARPASSSTCLATQLRMAPQAGNGAAGTVYMTVTLTNTASVSCTLGGYPGMQLLDSQGAQIPTDVVRGGPPAFPTPAANQPPAVVTLAPKQAAAFSLSYEDVPVGSETSCPTSSTAEITPPADTSYSEVPLQIAACGGGTVHVSPVYAAG